MSDLKRLTEALEMKMLHQRDHVEVPHDALEVLAKAARAYRDLLANGQRVEWCEEHKVPQQTTYVDDFKGEYECAEAPYSDKPCRIVSKLLIDPPTEEEPIDSDVVVSVEFDPMGGLDWPSEDTQ